MRETVGGRTKCGREGDGAKANVAERRPTRRCRPAKTAALVALAAVALALQTGCSTKARLLKADERKAIDRAIVEYPAGYSLESVVRGLSGATAMFGQSTDRGVQLAVDEINRAGGTLKAEYKTLDDASQKEQMVKAPSRPDRPSSVFSVR